MSARIRRRAVLLVAATTAVFALPAPASAGSLLDQLDGGCPPVETSQVFAPWGDPLQYALVPGGDFEAGSAAWSLAGGAAVVEGNQPFSATGTQSLRLPSGASATSPAFCVGTLSPTMRFHVRAPGSPAARLHVEVLTEDALVVESVPAGVELGLVGGWHPSLPALVVKNLLAALPDGAVAAVRLRAAGGAFGVDDVHVDPYGKR